MAEGPLRAHPIDELFEAVDERVGISTREKILAERGVARNHKVEGQQRRRDRERDVRANGSGEQR